MFKRRRAASNPAPKTPPSASASLAASKAFLQDRKSNGSLSSAAAAAALHAHPSPPTAVGDTVTKRMVRKASISSHGSGSQQLQGPGVRRQSSTASMTERSFRSASPSRNSPVVDRPDDAPPVPSVPKDVSAISAVRRRASSLEPQTRGGSPARTGSGRGHSMDSGTRASPTHLRVTSLSQVPEHASERPQSVNYSRPISPPSTTATAPLNTAKVGNSGWFAGPVVNTEHGFRGQQPAQSKTSGANLQYESNNTFQSIQNASNKPVSSRRSQLSHGVEGARLATGSMRAKPSGTGFPAYQHRSSQEPVDPKSADAVYDPSTRTFIRKQDAMERFRQLHEEEEPVEHHYVQYTAPPKPQSLPQSPPQSRPSRHSPVPPVTLEPLQDPSLPQLRSQPEPIPFEDARERYVSPPRHVEEEVPRHVEEREYTHQVDHISSEYAPIAIDKRVDAAQHAASPERGPEISRQMSEDYAGSDIHPPTDSNGDHGLDFIPIERVEEASEPPASPVLPANQDHPYPRIDSSPSRASTDVKVGRGRGSIRSDRGSSLSPPRNAHFAAVAVEMPNGVKHQPPPRSVSPAKSALKSSPSTSRRNSSPMVNNGRTLRKGPLSESSDAASDEGPVKRKKSVRVSFEEAPVIAGTSAYSEGEHQSPSKGLAQSRWSSTNPDEDLDDFMRPRPVLPSFGSIRSKDRGERDSGEAAEKVTETVSSSMSTSVASMKEPTGVSGDHALGGVVVNDFAAKHHPDPRDPLPPEVTSVEGSGYYSDSGSSDTALNDSVVVEQSETSQSARAEEQAHSIAEPKTLTTSVESAPPAVGVPEIAIQPASPGLTQDSHADPMEMRVVENRIEENRETQKVAESQKEATKVGRPIQLKERRPSIPGGWDDDQDSVHEEVPPIPLTFAPISSEPDSSAPSGRVTFAEQAPPRASQNQESESSDDDDSIYSDAYEELTDSEGGGFASIDKILESNAPVSPTGLMQSRFAAREPEIPLNATPQKKDEFGGGTTSSDLHEQDAVETHRDEEERPVPVDDRTERRSPPVVTDVPQSVDQPTSSPKPDNTKASAISDAPQPSRVTQPSSKTRKPALKKTTAAAPPPAAPETQFRKTMRGSSSDSQPTRSPDRGMRRSMRAEEPQSTVRASPGLAASRHSTPAPAAKQAAGALQKKKPAAAGAQKARPQSAAPPAKMVITPTYDSDSDASASSFQKERQRRRVTRNTGDHYTMRRSMRADNAPTMRSTPRVRSKSPPRQAPSSPQPFRKSLRPSSPMSEPGGTKSSRFSMRSLSPTGRFGMGKSSKAKAAAHAPSKPGLSSRFDDSSDDEFEARSKKIQSRFADSDDEDDFQLPPGLAPVRGIPKRPGDEDRDSTDLEDEESDDERPGTSRDAKKGPGTLTNGLHKSTHAPELDAGKKGKAKRGLFGFGKKKEKATTTEPSHAETQLTNVPTTDIPLPPAHRDRESSRPPLTPIGEEEQAIESPPRQRSPKLQRRVTPQWGRSASDSWPLPSPADGDGDRPQTADGPAQRRPSTRSTLSKRDGALPPTARMAVDPKTGKEVVVGRSGKKKKFQGLRRVFGLND